ncbi:DUF4395 family protein [Mycolicibacterium moriokaense]|uniref:Uncharacterized protein DUF4395 n=1 Tax=Mycolicibacterium moriokaense TaxID=39691 RepID=A0A318H581_9MYCO|nr:DUF4395 family protein [Mycolicibacterium moriokaense]PXW98870.1 uncharacterized protein DUF4395 [Mycolicibacterium moriokaense]
MTVNPTVRSRLEAQGFCGLDDETLAELAPWLRWTYSLGTLVTLIGVALMSPSVLWSLAAITSVGIVVPFHPFDLLYNYGMRYLTRTGPIPNSGPQRHFVFVVATVWLIATGWAFYAGATIIGIALGVLLIFVGGLASTTNFCIPSFIYNTVVGRRNAPSERWA